MMRLPPFTYVAPRRVEDAARQVAEHGPPAMLVAGGTDLYPNMKRRQFEPRVLVGLSGIRELHGVTGSSRNGLRIGSTTTLAAVSRHQEIVRHYPALATAAGLVSSPQLRNVGTIGGNVCVDTRCNYYNQSHAWRKAIGFCMKKDGDICLVAPGSPRCWAVSSSGPHTERTVRLSDLYRDDGIDYLAKRPEEVLAEILLPPAEGWRSAYLKLRRRGSFDFPVLGVAVAVRLEADIVREARIVLGAVASTPRETAGAGATLVGQRLEPDVIARAAELAAGPARPLDNTDYAHYYRKRMTRVFVSRALHRLAGRDGGGSAHQEDA
jgi:4-hydroxybenzoyl-CoA reductase subunit beta